MHIINDLKKKDHKNQKFYTKFLISKKNTALKDNVLRDNVLYTQFSVNGQQNNDRIINEM